VREASVRWKWVLLGKTEDSRYGDIIDNNVSDGPQIVRISPTDAAFITRGCGAWQKSG
jgi:hypothetical protein